MTQSLAATVDRAIEIARFNPATLRALVRDPHGTVQAALVVALASASIALASIDGAWVMLGLLVAGTAAFASGRLPLHPRPATGHGHVTTHAGVGAHLRALPGWAIALGGVALALALVLHLPGVLVPAIAWLAVSGIAWFACNQVVGSPWTRVSFTSLLRAVGFCFAPGVLAVLAPVPVVGAFAVAVAVVWTLLLLTFAIRHTARVGTGRAVAAAGLASAGAFIAISPLLVIASLF